MDHAVIGGKVYGLRAKDKAKDFSAAKNWLKIGDYAGRWTDGSEHVLEVLEGNKTRRLYVLTEETAETVSSDSKK